LKLAYNELIEVNELLGWSKRESKAIVAINALGIVAAMEEKK